MSQKVMELKSRMIKGIDSCKDFDEIKRWVQDWYLSIPHMEEFN